MANNHNQNGQDSTQQVINFLKVFKWRIVGFLAFLLIAILFLTLGFWNSTYHRFMFNWCRYWVYERP